MNWILKLFKSDFGGEREVVIEPKRRNLQQCDPYAKRRAKVIAQMGEVYVLHPANRVQRMVKKT